MEREYPELRADERAERDRLEARLARQRGERAAVEEVEVARQVVAAPVAAAEEARVERVEVRRLDEHLPAGPERAPDLPEHRHGIDHVLDQLVHDDQVEGADRQLDVLDPSAMHDEAGTLRRVRGHGRELDPLQTERHASVPGMAATPRGCRAAPSGISASTSDGTLAPRRLILAKALTSARMRPGGAAAG